VHPLSAELVAAQLRVVLRDLPVAAAKTGMLGTAGITSAVAAAFADAGDIPLIVDPILHATSGAVLLDDGALAPLRGDLLPLTTVLTPNLPEAEALLLRPVPVDGVVEAARALLRLGPRWVVLKGGHGAAPDRVEDVLVGPDGTVLRLSGPRIPTRDDHGTGCLFAACLTADLALGATAPQAFRRARRCLDRALREAQTFPAGRGAAFLRALSRR
jgi:hydroxymethylpyrimidine/phosphomethylpyrimidine kinase